MARAKFFAFFRFWFLLIGRSSRFHRQRKDRGPIKRKLKRRKSKRQVSKLEKRNLFHYT